VANDLQSGPLTSATVEHARADGTNCKQREQRDSPNTKTVRKGGQMSKIDDAADKIKNATDKAAQSAKDAAKAAGEKVKNAGETIKKQG